MQSLTPFRKQSYLISYCSRIFQNISEELQLEQLVKVEVAEHTACNFEGIFESRWQLRIATEAR